MITRLDRQRPGAAQPVARLANRADDVPQGRWAVSLHARLNAHPGFVHRGTHQVVHGSVHDTKILGSGFEVKHFSEQNARIAHQGAARLQNQFSMPMASLVQALEQLLDKIAWLGRLLLCVGDPQPATQIQMINRNPRGLYRVYQIQQSI